MKEKEKVYYVTQEDFIIGEIEKGLILRTPSKYFENLEEANEFKTKANFNEVENEIVRS